MKDIYYYLRKRGSRRVDGKLVLSTLVGEHVEVLGWEILDNKHKDKNSLAKYARLRVRARGGIYTVNTGSVTIMRQLSHIEARKAEFGEVDMGFSCTVAMDGSHFKLASELKKDETAQENEQ